MKVVLCGVRGSLPATGAEFQGIGGATSCVAIAHEGQAPSLVLDAGTGLRRLATLLKPNPFRGTIILGHLHWDHIMGIPFFPSGDHPDADVRFLVPEQGLDVMEVLSRAMRPPLFPISPAQLRGAWRFGTYDEGEFELEGFKVLAREIPHGGGRTMGLRISDDHSSIAYLSDHSPHSIGPGDDGFGELHPAAVALAQDVDVLIHDAQYTKSELVQKFTWGHTAVPYCVNLAERCNVKTLMMFHHDPMRTDDDVKELAASLTSDTVDIRIGVEGLEFTL
ncbi:MAG: MBL fold metallo-hydrolase [Actinomycetota bacterium]